MKYLKHLFQLCGHPTELSDHARGGNLNFESLVKPEGPTEAGGSAHIGIKSCVRGDIFDEISIAAG